ncbi:MAG: hypothetical protein OJF52_002051 [Nitrospira sp.]|nr:MAG: hypothetical protein OJF52_002051 [Nitrospira sp.]
MQPMDLEAWALCSLWLGMVLIFWHEAFSAPLSAISIF